MSASFVGFLSSYRVQGGLLIGLVFLTIINGFVAPPLSMIMESRDQKSQLEGLIERHKNFLAAPTPPPENLHLASLIFSVPQEQITEFVVGLQAGISADIRDSGARLLEQRRLPGDTSIPGITGEGFRFQFEGDLLHVTNILEGVASQEEPLLIQTLSVETVNGSRRPDMRLRVLLEVRVWLQSEETAS